MSGRNHSCLEAAPGIRWRNDGSAARQDAGIRKDAHHLLHALLGARVAHEPFVCDRDPETAVADYYSLVRVLATATVVRRRIFRSSQPDQFSMYQLSHSTRSLNDVLPRRPLICAQPVI